MNLVLFKALVKLHFVTPLGFLRLIYCFIREGLTLMSILRFTRYYYKHDIAFVSEGEKISYGELYSLAIRLTKVLKMRYGIDEGMRVGVLCRNHTVSALLLVALSRLGIHIRLLNTDIMSEKMDSLLKNKKMDYLIFDDELREKCLPAQLPCSSVSTQTIHELMGDKAKYEDVDLPHVWHGGEIAVLTGGSSGNYKEASRKTTLFQFLPPFFALLEDIKIQDYKSVFVVLPFYMDLG